MAQAAQDAGDGLDGDGAVELFLEIVRKVGREQVVVDFKSKVMPILIRDLAEKMPLGRQEPANRQECLPVRPGFPHEPQPLAR